jgi:ABC-type phosphate transport system substrate-binding protein
VVVNASNSVHSISVNDLSKIFLKRTTTWSSGQPVVPVDLSDTSSVRAAFSNAVHGRSVSAILAYWQRMIFSGRGVPPVQMASDRDVLAYVRAHPDAVGYVRNGTALGADVRTLAVAR